MFLHVSDGRRGGLFYIRENVHTTYDKNEKREISMSNTNKIVLPLPKQEMGEAEKMHRRNLENLIEIVQDIERAGKMIGRPSLLKDFLFHLLFVIGAMDQQEMLSQLGIVPQQKTRRKTACGRKPGTRKERVGCRT